MADTGVRILHIDDEPGFAEMVGDSLERADDRFSVETATAISDVSVQSVVTDVDCIVSDYEMPGQNGIEFLKTVRDVDADLPFILFTGKGSEAIASEAISAGVTDYLQKQPEPDQYTVLANRIRHAVDRYRADRASERQRTATETAREGSSILTADGEFSYVTQAFGALYGYEPAELVGEYWQRIYPAEEAAVAQDEILSTVAEDGRWSGETTGLRADGTTFPAGHRVTQTDSSELICAVRDLSMTSDQQSELTWYRTLVETLEDPVYVLDETGQFTYVNDAFVELVGYDRETILTATPALVKSDATIEQAEATLGQLLSADGADSARFETEIQPKHDDPIPCEDHMGVLPYDGECFEGSVGLLRDITERKAREQELKAQSRRYEEFAGIVSHDLRNPLTVAQGRIDLAQQTGDSEHLEAVATALDRMDRLIEDVLWLARERRDVGTMDAVALQATAADAWEMAADRLEHADLCYAEGVSTANIVADVDRLCQLFENLFRNAIDHGGETVTVTVGLIADGFYVEDDGPGIPDSDRDDVFTAGYSTKDDGTGFGLSIVNRIVAGHDWEIRVVTSGAGGARFEITGVEFVAE